MGLRVIDTFWGVNSCFTSAGFCKEKWDAYIRRHLPYAKQLIEKDSADYDFETQVLPTLNVVPFENDALLRLHASFESLVDNIDALVEQRLNTKLDAVIVLYIGLCNGAGWVVSLADVPHILLGIEKIIELSWYGKNEMTGLIYHELGHVWHRQARASDVPLLETPRERALWQLYSEGVAMYCEQLLCGDAEYYHQDKNGWLDWCKANRSALFGEYVRVIEARESHQKFFGDWCSYRGVSDVGYYLGCELVGKACETRSASEMLELSLSEIEVLLYDCAKR